MEVFGFNSEKTQAEMQRSNPGAFNPRVGRIHKPDRMIYIYSVAKRTFDISHLLFPKLKLRGCGEGERYVLCASVPDPMPQIAPDESNGGTRNYEEDGWRAAIDMLNPNNPTNDPYWSNGGALGAFFSTAQNCNLIDQGLFPSLNNPPTEEELKRAEKVRGDRFQKLVDKAINLEQFDPKELQAFLANEPDVHTAMDVLGLEANWHKRREIKMSCPNCGDQIKAGIAFHKSSVGIVCIIDEERARKAGLKVNADEEQEPEKRGPGRPRLDR